MPESRLDSLPTSYFTTTPLHIAYVQITKETRQDNGLSKMYLEYHVYRSSIEGVKSVQVYKKGKGTNVNMTEVLSVHCQRSRVLSVRFLDLVLGKPVEQAVHLVLQLGELMLWEHAQSVLNALAVH